MSWTNNSNGATGFTVERSPNNSSWTLAGTVSGSYTSGSTYTYTDSNLTELTAYYYRVEATSAGGSSTYDATASTVTTLPAAPSGLALSTPNSSHPDWIYLSWNDNSADATGYQVCGAPPMAGIFAADHHAAGVQRHYIYG